MRRGTLRAVPALVALLALSGCGDDGPASPGTPTGNTPTPTPAATPTPTPTPSPTPTPEPSPSNKPPTVTVTSSGGCHPAPAHPCTVSFNALASDPDGDAIRFGWDGCARGNNPVAICTISVPGPVTASVLVDDGNGGLAKGNASANGTNLPPSVRLPRGVPNPAPSNTNFPLAGNQPDDPEGDEDPNRLCTRATVVAVSGPCRASLSACGGVGDAFDITVTTLQGPGTCVIEARVADVWGAVGIERFSFTVSP
jgi:hypothetical protein